MVCDRLHGEAGLGAGPAVFSIVWWGVILPEGGAPALESDFAVFWIFRCWR